MSLPAFADTQPAETRVSVGVSNYQEQDVPQYLIVGGDNRRYDIDIWQFQLLTPAGRNWSVGFNLSREIMSGASPWATVLDPDEQAALIMSGATIDDTRSETSVSVTHYGDDNDATLAITRSREDDYDADAIAVSGERSFNNGLTTVSAGLSYSQDLIRPTDALMFGRIQNAKRWSRSGFVGVSQVLDANSALYVGLSGTDHTGFLSDPYKLRDVRPDERLEWALGVRYRRFLESLDASLHVDYRHYRDDWDIASHTLHTSWYQNIGRSFQLVPNVRYYSQSEAEFYRSFDDFSLPLTVPQSSDFRLSAYGAFTVGVKGILRRPGWSVTLSADRYMAREKYGLTSGMEHPANLAFVLASIVLDFEF